MRQRSVRRSPALFSGAKQEFSWFNNGEFKCPGVGRERREQLFLSRNKTVLSSLLKEANTVTAQSFPGGPELTLQLWLQLAVWHKMRFIKSVTLAQAQEEVWEEGREKLLVLVLFIF